MNQNDSVSSPIENKPPADDKSPVDDKSPKKPDLENSKNDRPKYNLPNTNDNVSDDKKNSSAPGMGKVHTRYKLVRVIVILTLSLGILLGFANGLLFDKSFLQDAWSITHQMQMMLLLTLINSNAKYEVENLILDCSFSALSIFLFPVKMLKSAPLIKQLHSIEPDQHLLNLGATTGSTVVSCIFLLLLLMALAIVILLSF